MRESPERTGSIIRAVIFAPLAAAAAVAFLLFCFELLDMGAVRAMSLSLAAFGVSAMAAYVMVIIAGLPALWILNAMRIIWASAYAGLGLFAALVFLWWLTGHGDIVSAMTYTPMDIMLPVMLGGLTGGFVFWMLAKPFELTPHRLRLYDQ